MPSSGPVGGDIGRMATGERKAIVSPSVKRDMRGYVKPRRTIASVDHRGRQLAIKIPEGKRIPLRAGKSVNIQISTDSESYSFRSGQDPGEAFSLTTRTWIRTLPVRIARG
jgi:hypothetical protein